MAVFSGGCTLEALEEVCSGDPVAREAVIDLVTGLVARSLVVAEDRGLGTRYRLLETIRQYGEERLAVWGETGELLTRHGQFYADLLARAAQHSYGPEQHSWANRLTLERDNARLALATAIESNNGALAIRLVSSHPNRHGQGAMPLGAVLAGPVSRVLELADAPQSPGYQRVMMLAAYQTFYTGGDYAVASELCQKAIDAELRQSGPPDGPRIEMDACSLQAMASFSVGDYAGAVDGYTRAAAVARVDGYPGVAAVYLSYSVNARLLGGVGTQQVIPEAEDSVALARRSGMPGAILQSLSAFALALAEHDPARARAALEESIERGDQFDEDISGSFLTGAMVAGRLHDWILTLKLTARAMTMWRWDMSPLWAAICLAECARAFAEDKPEVAGILRGAAYATFHNMLDWAERQPGATPERDSSSRSDTSRVDASANFVLAALREAGDLVTAALGDDRRRELRAAGAAMSMEEAISYAVANIDPKLLSDPIVQRGGGA